MQQMCKYTGKKFGIFQDPIEQEGSPSSQTTDLYVIVFTTTA